MQGSDFDKRLIAEMIHCMVMDWATPPEVISVPGGSWKYGPRILSKGTAGSVFGHCLQGTLEHAGTTLCAFGVMEPCNEDGSAFTSNGRPAYFRLLVDAKFVANHVLNNFPQRPLSIEVVFTDFIGMVTYHNTMPTTRKTFAAREEYVPVLTLLAEAGYVGRVGQAFRWADKALSAMRESGHWTEDGRSNADIYQDELETIWRTMPLDIKKAFFFSGAADILSFEIVYSERWRDGRWQQPLPRKDGKIILHGNGAAIHRDLVKRFVEPFRLGTE